MNFYDAIADDYDAMMAFEDRLGKARQFITRLRQHHRFTSALDMACGSGAYALALAAAGVPRVVGADPSARMLASARQHASEPNFDVDWRQVSMQELDQVDVGQFDLILCLGNSLPHLLTPEDLKQSLTGFRNALNEAGLLVLQTLNYDQILAAQERIVGVTRRDNREFIRFYDFTPPLVQFNLLTLDWHGEQCRSRLEQTQLYPYRQSELEDALAAAGFSRIDCFGGLGREPFEAETSETLLIEAG
jgi:SAM-dependent methyltransferase